jgi:hypothetical protein
MWVYFLGLRAIGMLLQALPSLMGLKNGTLQMFWESYHAHFFLSQFSSEVRGP